MENVKQILFVNACMRGPERSRTWKLCQTFLNACKNRWPEAEIRERDLTAAPLPVLTTELDDRRHQRFPKIPGTPCSARPMRWPRPTWWWSGPPTGT